MNKIRINMYARGLNIKGQGVGSAFIEQVRIVSDIDDFDVYVNARHKNDFDIRHIHTINLSHYFKMNKKRINVCYVHFIPEIDDGSLHMPKLLFRLYRRYTLAFYKKADELVVVNPYFISKLIEIGIPKDRITYIPNYVSRLRFYELNEGDKLKIRKKFKIPKNSFVVLGVGQTQTRKGVLDFIEVAKRNPEMLFLWAGGFSFGAITAGYDEIKGVMENSPSNVRFLGIIPRDDMNGLYNAANVLFLPSYQELFPMTILEAINTNLPFVVRNLEMYKDILFKGYIYGENNEDFSSILNELRNSQGYYLKAREISSKLALYYGEEHIKSMRNKYYKKVYAKYPFKTLAYKKHK
jgi:1,2-diacylglycerol-3-alpha-glucose alpha-1,2-galactosyltransferase